MRHWTMVNKLRIYLEKMEVGLTGNLSWVGQYSTKKQVTIKESSWTGPCYWINKNKGVAILISSTFPMLGLHLAF